MAAIDSGPESLLAIAHALRHSVASSFDSTQAAPAHPLGRIAPGALPALRIKLSEAISQLRTGLAALSDLALPPPPPPPAQPDGAPSAATPQPELSSRSRDRDRYLTLLRDAASAESPLLDHRSAARDGIHSLLSRRNADWASLFPARMSVEGSGALGILDTLELLAEDLRLVHLRDDPSQDGAGGTGSEAPGPVVLSLGGRLMAVDVELSTSVPPTVERIKVAYVVAGHDSLCPIASDKLHALLAAEGGDRAQQRWRGVRTLLEQLQELDEATERTGDDCFARLTRTLPDELAAALPGSEEHSEDPVDSLRLRASESSLRPLVTYYSPPFANGSDSALTAEVTLCSIVDGQYADPQRPYVARLNPPVPLTTRTARQVCLALGLSAPRMEDGDEDSATPSETDGRVNEWVTALLGDAQGLDLTRTVGHVASHPDCPPLSFTLAQPSAALSPRVDVSTTRPLLATYLRFSDGQQLIRALRILQAQVRANELLRSAVLPLNAAGSSAATAPVDRPSKRPRTASKGSLARTAGEMTLDDLFAASAPDAPSPALPLSVHPTASPAGPGVTFTFPLPASAAAGEHAGAPIALELVCPFDPASKDGGIAEGTKASAYRAKLYLPAGMKLPWLAPTLDSMDGSAETRVERRVARVAQAAGGNAGLVLREVLRQLNGTSRSAAQGERAGQS